MIKTSSQWRQREADSCYRPICWENPAIDNAEKGGPGPGEYFEHIAGAEYPHGWMQSDFDDRSWGPAPTYGLANGQFEECLSSSYQLARIRPVVVKKLGQGNYLVDFGSTVFAGIELSPPKARGAVELRLGEELLPDNHVRYLLRTGNCYQELWTFGDQEGALFHFGLRMFRYAEVAGWTLSLIHI